MEDISAEVAGRRVAGFPHSIGQLVFHMNYWMDYELRRIRGETAGISRAQLGELPLAGTSARRAGMGPVQEQFARGCWPQYAELGEIFARGNRARRSRAVHEGDKKVAGTLEAVLWQMVAHNSYHVGQIAMIRRVVGAWPPRGGGDTW